MTAYEASSSSSFKSKLWNYDVFLSFRGEDTRKGFTGHLHATLKDRGYQAYMDEEGLNRGGKIKEELLWAIEGSRISVIVFSKGYADSSWCLDELVKIMECRSKLGRHVLPIFYHVDPSHVRKQDGDLAKAFQKHKKGISKVKDGKKREAKQERVKQWRKALTEAANLSGHHLQITDNGCEAEFIRKIVDENICKWLTSTNKLHVANHPVGINSRIQDIITYLSSGGSNDVRMVGIWGMGGVGKTTAAKAIYNQIHHMFQFKSFLTDVRDATSKHALVDLQKNLISNVLKKKPEISCVDEGKVMIKQQFQHKRVLVIMDNIDEVEQLEAIVGNHDWFGLGSRIILTTRDEHLLKQGKVHNIYPAQKFNKREALELFSWHAFGNSCPNKGYLELSKKVVSYCGGLPLALKVLGSFLFERTVAEWESQLEKLKRTLDGKIINPLRISFDGLDDTQKALFLDISCFFIGKDKDYVAKMLDVCGFFATIGINVLRERCLVTVEDNKLNMHDLLREMAKVIISKKSPGHPGKWSRLWNNQEVVNVLRNKSGTKEVEGLALHFSHLSLSSKRPSFSTEAFANMKKLRLLYLEDVELNGEYKHLPRELMWLCWPGCPLKSIPDDFFNQDKLVGLEMQWSRLVQVWDCSKSLQNLKIINLTSSRFLFKSPDFSQVPNLQELIMDKCVSLSEIHPSIGHLKRLSLVSLQGCEKLWSLPRDFYKSKSVETLLLARSKLREVHEDLGEMISLQCLDLGWSHFRILPSLSGLSKLETLVLNDCDNLHTISDLPTSLKVLYASGCPALETMPDFSEMSNMRELNVNDSPELTEVPGLDKSLNSMTRIDMNNCTNLTADFEKKILQGWTSCGFGGIFLCGNFVPDWFEFVSEGPKVSFDIPPNDGRPFEGLTLCLMSRYIHLDGIIVINNTKRTELKTSIGSRNWGCWNTQVLWQGQLSNDTLKLESGDKVEIYQPCIINEEMTTMVNLVWNKHMKENTHDLDKANYVFDPHPARFYKKSSDDYESSEDYESQDDYDPSNYMGSSTDEDEVEESCTDQYEDEDEVEESCTDEDEELEYIRIHIR